MSKSIRKLLLPIVFIAITIVTLACGSQMVSLSFNTMEGQPLSAIEVEQGHVFSEIPTPQRQGYSFIGWYEDEEYTYEFDISEPLMRNLRLYAKWEINEYTMSFDTGDGTDIPPLVQDFNTNVTRPEDPIKPGHTFLGWYTDPEANPDLDTPYTFHRMPGESVTIYALWEVHKFDITFHDEQGTIVRSVEYGDTLTDVPTPGFTFTDTDDSGYIPETPFSEGYTAVWDVLDFTNITEDMDVHAIYTINEYAVIFEDEYGNIYSTQTITHGETAELPDTEPSLEGHVFQGYFPANVLDYTITENTVVEVIFQINIYTVFFYSDGVLVKQENVAHGHAAEPPTITPPDGYSLIGWDADYTSITDEITISSIIEVNEYTITLHAGDGEFGSGLDIKTITQDYDTIVGIPEEPTLTGYSFDGWYDNPELTGDAVIFSAMSEMPLGGATLYAKWTPNTYTVTLDYAGGSETITTKSVSYDQEIGSLPGTSRTGYTFLGWFDEYNQVVTSSTVYNLLDDMTLTAKWEPITFTIIFRADGLNIHFIYDFAYGDTIDPGAVPAIPHKAHYDDVAPYWNRDLSEPIQFTGGNLTIGAVYTPNIYAITFDSQGGSAVADIVEPVDSSISAPINPTKDGYSFIGWYTAPTGGTPFTFDTMPGDGATLYARWTEWPVITLELDGGSGTEFITEESGEPVSEPADPTKAGYIFAGWYEDALFTTPFDFTGFEMPAEDMTLYAKWDVGTADYHVHVYEQNPDGSYPEEPTETFTYSDTTESTVSYTPDPDAHFKLDTGAANILSGEVIGDGSLILTVFYARESYEATLYYGFDTPEIIETTDPILYGAPMSELGLHPTAREGYTFIGWYDPIAGITYDENSLMPGDIDLYAQWQLNTYSVSGRHIFEIEDLIDYERTGVMSPDADDILFSHSNIPHGTPFMPIITYPGYVFNRIIIDGVTYTLDNINDIPDITNNLEDIEVYYDRIVLKIEFIQTPAEAGGPDEVIIDEFYIHYNDTFTETLPEIIIEDTDYTAVWDRILFNNVRQNITVAAMYYQVGVQTVTFMDDGSIRYIASNIPGADDQILTDEALLWNLTRTGYRFLGWFTAPTGGSKLEIEDMKFSEFVDSVQIYAQWVAIDSFNAPTKIDIEVDEITEDINISFELNPIQIEATHPTGFNFYVNMRLVAVDLADVSIDGNVVTLHLTPMDALYADFEALLLPGIHEVTIQAVGDGYNHLTGPMSSPPYQFSVDTVIEGDVTDSQTYDYFIVEDILIQGEESKRYVFYTDMTYNFPSHYEFEIISGGEHVQADGRTLTTTNTPGDFRFIMRVYDGEEVTATYVYHGRVVANINQFSVGSNYDTYLSEIADPSYLRTDIFDDFLVGFRNDFAFDLRIRDNAGQRVPLANVRLEYEFYLEGSTTALTPSEVDDYVLFLDNNQFRFRQAAEGHSFTVIVRPSYQANLMTVPDAEFDVTINDAHNAFTNEQLRALFRDMTVKTINIMSNITAQLAPNQLNADGSPINTRANTSTGDIKGNVYGRANNNTANEEFIINGNYMTINGRDLPYSNRDSGAGVLGYSAAFEVINVQISIFLYQVSDASGPEGVNQNSVTFNNLTILSNTNTPAINYGLSAEEIAHQEQLMSRNSGGFNGIMVRDGSSYINNVRVGYSLIPYFNTSYGSLVEGEDRDDHPVYMNLDYVMAYNTWANSIYSSSATGATISNSFIGSSGGPAIHTDDRRPGGGIDNPTIIIDDHTVFDNWISGTEAWFKAYAMDLVAIQLKTNVEDAVSASGKTIIQERINPITGNPSEMMNVIMLTEPKPGATDDPNDPTTGPEVEIYLTDSIATVFLHRAFDFLSDPTDPRVQSGSFLFPVGHLSETAAFTAAVGYGMSTWGLSAEDAGDLAYIAGFYNLTMDQAYQVYGAVLTNGVSFPEAVDAIMGSDHPRPRYLEILYQLPLFPSGFSTIIIEVYDQE